MTQDEQRHAALTLAVQTAGDPNKVGLASSYLAFIRADADTAKAAQRPNTGALPKKTSP